MASFTNGKTLRFTVGHGPQHNRSVTRMVSGRMEVRPPRRSRMADLFGGELLLPDGMIDSPRHDLQRHDHRAVAPSTARIGNRIGDGYSNLDGFGFINAEAAVQAPLN